MYFSIGEAVVKIHCHLIKIIQKISHFNIAMSNGPLHLKTILFNETQVFKELALLLNVKGFGWHRQGSTLERKR